MIHRTMANGIVPRVSMSALPPDEFARCRDHVFGRQRAVLFHIPFSSDFRVIVQQIVRLGGTDSRTERATYT